MEIIKDDVFRLDDVYVVDTKFPKLCWGCETKQNFGYMVYDTSKMRRIFFCENCFTKLKN